MGDERVVFTEARAYKVKRLRRDPRVRVAACDWRGGNTEAYFDGHGRVVTDPGEEARAYRALHASYGWQMKLADAGSWLAGRIDARAVLALRLDETADRPA